MAENQENQTFFSWNPNEKFDLSGIELEMMLSFLNSKLNNFQAQEIIAMYEIKKLLDKKVTDGVKDGKVTVKSESPN